MVSFSRVNLENGVKRPWTVAIVESDVHTTTHFASVGGQALVLTARNDRCCPSRRSVHRALDVALEQTHTVTH